MIKAAGLALILWLTALGLASEAAAARTDVEMSGAEALALSERFVRAGRLTEADAILSQLSTARADAVDPLQLQFLRGQIAVMREDFEAAADVYAAMLNENPDLPRIRLELARALFLLKRDGAAAYHFRLALADNPPEAVRQNIEAFLQQIRARKVWSVEANVAIAPDSNVNAGPTDDRTELFGLPFELNEEAQATSGFGLSAAITGSVYPRLSKRWRLEARGSARLLDYQGVLFDDLFTAVEAGPRYEGDKASVSVLATGTKRWFGGEEYSESVGGRVTLTRGFTQRFLSIARLSVADVAYETETFRDGPTYSIGLDGVFALNRRSLARFGFLVGREQARVKAYRNNQYRIAGGYRRELPLGVTADTTPEVSYRLFEAPLNFTENGELLTREDWTYGVTLNLIKRDWSWYGFAPVFTYSYFRNESNIDFFSYDRHRGQVGVTRVF